MPVLQASTILDCYALALLSANQGFKPRSQPEPTCLKFMQPIAAGMKWRDRQQQPAASCEPLPSMNISLETRKDVFLDTKFQIPGKQLDSDRIMRGDT
jgi:hypothetical protein